MSRTTINNGDSGSTVRTAINNMFTELYNGSISSIQTKTTDYTAVLSDGGGLIYMDTTGGNLNLTIPPNSSVAFPIKTIICIERLATNTLTIVQGSGVTITGSSGTLTDAGQNVLMMLIKTGTDTWDLQNGGTNTVIDFSGSTVVTGFSSLTTTVFDYVLYGKMVFCVVQFVGTSNATGFTFTLPFNSNRNTRFSPIVDDSGSGNNGRMNLLAASNVASVFKSATAGAFTASGSKQLAISFIYERV